MLIILQELMYKAFVEAEGRPPKQKEIPKPCHYFDLIAGTGTGGLIAIMLGRLRLDLETCMDVYVRMTKKVFETDKTIAGIPYKQTLFKASKLEEAIKQCVMEHTVYEDEGNDGTAKGGRDFGVTPISPSVARSMSIRSTKSFASTNRNSLMSPGPGFGPSPTLFGNPDASLYDDREHRTKTAVTAVYEGTNPRTGSAILLRSYDSRKEPAPEFNCTIWQAGRATSATGLAFKPVKIGQSTFIDEGAGKYNPSIQILDEAVTNEWPGRDLGIFVTIGTGKRPSGTNHNQHEWWEGFVGSTVGNFAEARRRLMAKIEGCEDTHQHMVNVELPRRGIPIENYCRLNVEVGVGEFGMNEWDRLSEMTIGTRRYLGKPDTQELVQNAARRIAKIHIMHKRLRGGDPNHSRQESWAVPPASNHHEVDGASQHHWPTAVELAAEPVQTSSPTRTPQSGRTSIVQPQIQFRPPASNLPYPDDRSYTSGGDSNVAFDGSAFSRRSQDQSSYIYRPGDEQGADTSPNEPPPRPPKTPINDAPSPHLKVSPISARPGSGHRLPYPLDEADARPPPVSKLRKPTYRPS